jgi:catechol 2,3-dioxygenase-like lactoylglutathione lyase family enzyme
MENVVSEPKAAFLGAIPALASLDIQRSVDFFCEVLGFSRVHAVQGEYGIVANGPVEIHFWACSEPHIAANTSCRVQVKGIESLYASCQAAGAVHPMAPLGSRPWGTTEFGIVDPDGNLVTFFQRAAA